MENIRKIQQILRSKPTLEGAGVHLKRVFGFHEVPSLDPFLLLDDFGSDNPNDYLAGFPWHPHRGIETITYMLQGEVKHEDSLGNGGIIHSGDVQWMTAGSGIIHQEMPLRTEGLLRGFQLWANLPASHKMMDPRYRDVKKGKIPEISLNDKVRARIICGQLNGTQGPVQNIITDPEYLDISIASEAEFFHSVKSGHKALAFVFEGAAYFDPDHSRMIGSSHLVIFEDGDTIGITTDSESVRFLLISGKPIGEPVAWWGPIVMNTEAELKIAFEEYRKGTFLKHKQTEWPEFYQK